MKMQTKWNLKLLYKSPKDPQIQRDLNATEKSFKTFSALWRQNEGYCTDEQVLFKALRDYEKIMKENPGRKAVRYFGFLCDIDKKNAYANAQNTKIEQFFAKVSNEIVFFNLNLAKITPDNQEKFLKSSLLKEYHYFLERVFERARYKLSESEEKVLSLISTPAYSAWVDGVDKLLSDQKILWKGSVIGLGQASNMISASPRADRLKIDALILEKIKTVAPFAEAEINAIFTEKKITDELRGYFHPYSAMVIANQNREEPVAAFVNLVTKYFSIPKKFYKVKKKILGVSGKLAHSDRGARFGSLNQSFDFKRSVDITRKAFRQVDDEFAEIFDRFLRNGHIDVAPKIGKTSGAYCANSYGVPTFVLLNHVSSLGSLKTLAHEMGHAIHSELSKSQPFFYQGYSLSTAETASTLFENFVFEEVFKTLSKKEQIIALHDRIQDDVATIFRQIAFFNFEKELHALIRKEGFVAKEEISALMNKHLMSYLGPEFKLKPDDGLFWVQLSHIRRFFYVYTYAYGQLVSKAMYAKYKEDKSFVEKIKHFLRAGGSKSPEDIFKDIGIDTSKPAFWVAGLKTIEEDIKRLEKLAFK